VAALSCLETIHSLTLEHFETSGSQNERLWLKINIKLAKLLLSRKDYVKLGAVLQRLHKVVELPDGSDDPNKGTYAIEIFALEILMLTEIKDIVRLRVSKVILANILPFNHQRLSDHHDSRRISIDAHCVCDRPFPTPKTWA